MTFSLASEFTASLNSITELLPRSGDLWLRTPATESPFILHFCSHRLVPAVRELTPTINSQDLGERHVLFSDPLELVSKFRPVAFIPSTGGVALLQPTSPVIFLCHAFTLCSLFPPGNSKPLFAFLSWHRALEYVILSSLLIVNCFHFIFCEIHCGIDIPYKRCLGNQRLLNPSRPGPPDTKVGLCGKLLSFWETCS